MPLELKLVAGIKRFAHLFALMKLGRIIFRLHF